MRTCGGAVVGIDTEDTGRGHNSVFSVQLVGEDRRAYLRRRRGEDVGAFRARALEELRAFGPADLWAVNAAYDAANLGLISRGVSAHRTSRGYTCLQHPALGESVLFDTRALVDASCAQLGESVGLVKLPFEPRSEDYAMRDAEIPRRWILEFRDGLRALAPGAELRATAGATASAVWKALGGSVEPLPAALRAATRAAYRGGRVEVLEFGRRATVEVWDLRSAFPAAMRRGGYPCGTWRSSRTLEPHGLYDATVLTHGWLGPLPMRCDGATCYPVGRFRGVWYGEELMLPGVQVVRIHSGWSTRETCDPFAVYVDSLWSARNAPDVAGRAPPTKLAGKVLLNALYGVIGHSGSVAGLATVGPGCRLEGIYVAPDVLAWQLHRRPSQGTNPAWSGLTTARVRAQLYRAALPQRGRLVYLDTDSLFLVGDGEGFDAPAPAGEGLGEWRLVERATEAEMVAPKCYALRTLHGWAYRAKGVRRDDAEDYIVHGRARWRAPLTAIQAAVRGEDVGTWQYVERSLRREYRARRVLEGGRTEPWDAGELVPELAWQDETRW